MNKRIKKKLAKRSYVYHYCDYQMLAKAFITFLNNTGHGGYDAIGHHIIVDEHARRIWVELIKSFRHGHRPKLSYQHLRFARHLKVVDTHNNPPLPPIVLTERPDPTPFVPIILGGPIKKLRDAICECLRDSDDINEYHGIVEGDEVQ